MPDSDAKEIRSWLRFLLALVEWARSELEMELELELVLELGPRRWVLGRSLISSRIIAGSPLLAFTSWASTVSFVVAAEAAMLRLSRMASIARFMDFNKKCACGDGYFLAIKHSQGFSNSPKKYN